MDKGQCGYCNGTGECVDCDGKGSNDDDECPHCYNVGNVPCSSCTVGFHANPGLCAECDGTGMSYED